MAEFPALPLWTDALIGDTYHLTPAQFGAYLRLLIVQWRTKDCSLPNDDVFLGRSIGDPKNWHRLKPVVMSFFTLGGDGRYRQHRLLDERDYCSRKAEASSAAGRASALKRLHRGSTATQRNFNEISTPTPIPTPILSSKKENATPSGGRVVFNDASLPDWICREAWAGYLEMRQRIRAPMTARAKTLAVASLEKLRMGGDDPAQVLDQSTQNSWKGLFPIKQNGEKNGRSAKQSNHERAYDAAARLATDILSGSHRLSGNGREAGSSGSATITLLPTRTNKPTD